MPANEHEIKDAIDETIRFMFMSAPHRIICDLKGKVTGLEIHKMKFDGFDSSGRKRPIETGETAIIECSAVILAVGEKVDPAGDGIIGGMDIHDTPQYLS